MIAQQRPHSIVTSLNLTKSFRLLTHMFKHESTVNETYATILFLPCDGSVANLKGAGGGYNDSLNPFQLPPCMQPYNGVKVQRTSNISINVFPIACNSKHSETRLLPLVWGAFVGAVGGGGGCPLSPSCYILTSPRKFFKPCIILTCILGFDRWQLLLYHTHPTS